MKPNKTSQNARLVALFSFVIGSAIFVLYYVSDEPLLLPLAECFIAIVGIINVIYFVRVFRLTGKANEDIRTLYGTCGVILLNVPILFLYCWWTSTLLNTMRITFENETTSRLTDIRIFGCEEKHINSLEPNEKKLVWISISGACSVNIEFNANGKRESENVSVYTIENMGRRITHKIGWENAPAIY